MIAKLEWTQINAQQNMEQLQNPTVEIMNQQQQQNHHLRTDSSLNAFYWYQIFALDSAVVEAQKMLSSHGGFLTSTMYHHRETI